MTEEGLTYLLARIESLRTLVSSLANAIAESMNLVDDGREEHTLHLEAHLARVAHLRLEAKGTPLGQLSQRFELEVFDEDILLLALSTSLDRSFGQLLGALQRSYTSVRPSVDLVLGLLTTNFRDRLAAMRRFEPEARLLSHGLIILTKSAMTPGLLAREIHVAEHLQRELLFGDSEVRTISEYAKVSTPELGFDEVLLPPAIKTRLCAVLESHDRLNKIAGRGASIILLSGASGVGKTVTAEACASHLSAPLMSIDGAALHSQLGRAGASLNLLMREAATLGAVVFFDNCELLFGTRLQGNRDLLSILELLASVPVPVILASSLEAMIDPMVLRRVLLRVALEVPSIKTRERLWARHLDVDVALEEKLDLPFFAEKYDFNGGEIVLAARLALALALEQNPGAPVLTSAILEDACETRRQHHLTELAVHTTTHLRLSDLVLPDDLMTTIRSILAAVRNRRRIFEDWGFGTRLTTGRGLSMLFRGSSGTGKTLSAEIIAAELSQPLYRVSIPRVVSKYIGETEQNLEKAFREAEVAGAILLFDEADSIFSKRVDVNSSVDRYSNMEVNLLLQEMERFEGVVILTTNLDAAIDDAFERRINYKLDFPFPEEAMRLQIWRQLLPDDAPVLMEEGELSYLAERFVLTGGSIKNVVLRAAYTAAEAEDPINIENLEAAAFQEYKEQGKLIQNI